MRSTLALLALTASAAAQAVTQLIVPSSTAPAGCENSRQGKFTITIVNVTAPVPAASRRSFDLLPRQNAGVLTLSLTGGILTDQAARTGYVASNYQFQFDAPPQAGAIYTGGFSICANGSLALGGSAIWWQCLSGTFFNLYDRNWAPHCVPVYFQAIEGAGSVYETSPPVPVTTGPDQNTIANGGGTQGQDTTGVGIGVSATSGAPVSASASKTGSASGASASANSRASSASGSVSSAASSGDSAASGASSSASEAASSASAAVTSSSSGGAVAMATEAPQALLAWAAGLIGAMVLV